MDLLRHAPYTRKEICQGAGVGLSVVNTLIQAGVLQPIIRPKRKSMTSRWAASLK